MLITSFKNKESSQWIIKIQLPPRLAYPAVSVIIPMYDVEKYIAQCLDSVLAQTFQDFEIIVVDDCSTDNSHEVAESYVEKFGGRMTVIKTKKNSGNAGYTARNRGLSFSRGEYVFFVDADDFITKTALEELYTLAKEYEVDVVYTGARYRYTTEDGERLTRDKIGRKFLAEGVEEEPILTINDPYKNLKPLILEKASLYWTPWTKFVRRNFLTEKEITFQEITSGGDFIWTIELFACAERFLRIPNAVYFWRDDSYTSVTRQKRKNKKQIGFWCGVIIAMINSINNLSNRLDIMRENPAYIYGALNHCLRTNFNRIVNERLQISSKKLFEILRKELENKNDFNLMLAFFLSVIDVNQKELSAAQQRIAELEKKLESD